MYVLRGLAVSLEIFLLVYVCLSMAVAACANKLLACARRFSPAKSASLLFLVRTMPLLASLAITACFTVPSFLRFEPHATDEPIGVLAIVLSFAGLALIASGTVRAAFASRRTSRQVAAWVNSSNHVKIYGGVPAFSTQKSAPALAVSGIRSPKLLISSGASAEFTDDEMRAAVSHELAHIRCRDNLKKALLCLCVFPGMSKIERAWTEAAEMAADNAAVSSEREALDLASALIKISRLAPVARTPELAMSLVPDSSSVGDRVQRLLAWKEPNATRQCKRGLCAGISLTILAAALATITYPPALGYMHTLTEMLIR